MDTLRHIKGAEFFYAIESPSSSESGNFRRTEVTAVEGSPVEADVLRVMVSPCPRFLSMKDARGRERSATWKDVAEIAVDSLSAAAECPADVSFDLFLRWSP